jgi:S-DNA-T family DNA segregation ATPase FtsK/SpoIIIE
MERRYQMFADMGVRNIDGYNLRREDDDELENLPYLVVVIDELADLMMTTPEEVETLLARLCQMARATGIHMLIATQRPSVDVLTGLIKANVPARIAFAVTSLTDSRVILDLPGAERLLGRGDMLYLPPDAAKPVRVQGSFIPDNDLVDIVTFWRKQQPRMDFDTEWAEFTAVDPADDADDPLRQQAIDIVRRQGSASASMLQRRLRIGYNRAARLIESMEDEGLIGPADGARTRTVLFESDD